MGWTKLNYSKGQVDKAGAFLITPLQGNENAEYYVALKAAFEVFSNWRSTHAFPLNTLQMLLRRIAKSVDKGALIAQRLKRVESIFNKLRRFPKMNLSRMQDIGGCRAIVANVANVKEMQAKYANSGSQHEPCPGSDYIETPKEDGYRGVHLIYKYKSNDHPDYNGLRIEIQLRSRVQHAWATAVETVDTFTQQSLKSDKGTEEWQRFFKLMGSVFAIAEKCPRVPGVPEDIKDLRAEVAELNAKLKVDELLGAYQEASVIVDKEKHSKDAKYFLLLRDSKAMTSEFIGFRKEHLEDANQMYLDFEKEYKGQPKQAVLVSVDSIGALKKAYPNYFGDTRVFLQHLRQFVKPQAHLSAGLGTSAPPTIPLPTVPPPTVPPPTVPPPTNPV